MAESGDIAAPYPGLRPFEDHETPIFFGREGHVSRMLDILRRERFLAVIGSSGSGKSSLVRAGLLPALYLGWATDSSDWRIAVMRPGDRPLHRLAEALLAPEALGPELGGGAGATALLQAELRRGPLALVGSVADALRVRAVPRPLRLMLLVDQFEELFRYAATGGAPGDEADAFVNLLLQPRLEAGEAAAAVHVALTMRTDALHECTRFLELPEAINAAQYLTPRMKPAELRRAITEPARVFGGEIDPGVVTTLVNAVVDQPDQLPILQHALARMWASAQAREPAHPRIGVADVESVGGIAQALSHHADGVWAQLPAPQQQAAEELFRAITERPEGGGRRDARRPQRLAEIARFAGRAPEDWPVYLPVLKAFGAEGVNFVHCAEPPDGDSVVDISHEAVIRQWQRLRDWVEDEGERAAEYRRWRNRCDESGERLIGGDLAAALRWRDGGPTSGWAARYARSPEREAAALEFRRVMEFIERSSAQAAALEAQARAEQERVARIELEAQRERAERGRRRTRQAVTFAMLALLVAGIFGWQWWAVSRTKRELAKTYADLRVAQEGERKQLAVALAAQAETERQLEALQAAQAEAASLRAEAERLQLAMSTLRTRSIASTPLPVTAPAARPEPARPSPVPPAVGERPPAAGTGPTVTADQLGRLMPAVPAARREEWARVLDAAMKEYGIDTARRQAAFLAQAAHETGQLRYLVEPWGPTSQQQRYEPPSSLATSLGNVAAGDGERYRGRGLIWITGRANYQRFGAAVGVDLVADPELASRPDIASRTAAWYWKSRGLNELADTEDTAGITRRINGGVNGLDARTQLYERAKSVLGG